MLAFLLPDKIETKVNIKDKQPTIDGSIVGNVEVILNDEVLGSRNLYFSKPSITEDKSFLSKLLEILKFWR